MRGEMSEYSDLLNGLVCGNEERKIYAESEERKNNSIIDSVIVRKREKNGRKKYWCFASAMF